MSASTRLPALIVLLLAALALTGCGQDSAEAGDGTGHNDADVAFATDMIQHHAQALTMVDLTLGKELDPEVADLAEQIRAAQSPEIETMVDWLNEWDEPVPETMRDHANAHGGHSEDMDTDMPGMMSAEQMAELEKARGEEFQTLWLELMVEHHEGAIEMARTEQANGENAKAVALAEKIVKTQQREIDTMEQLLGS
jgi:uncharacterized protein (DUF305 family)